jgi:hypothetical protein
MDLMRRQMELMQEQMQQFFRYFQTEMLRRSAAGREPNPAEGALVPIRRPFAVASYPERAGDKKKK